MDDPDLLNEIRELRQTIQAAVIVLISQKVRTEHPHRGLAECEANAVEILQDAIALSRAVA
jgi:hypothetical protein